MEVDEENKVVGNSESDQAVTIPEEASKPVEPSVGVKREAESGPGASSKPPPGPKRKKVLKTRINDRGKEGNETRELMLLLGMIVMFVFIVSILLRCDCLLE